VPREDITASPDDSDVDEHHTTEDALEAASRAASPRTKPSGDSGVTIVLFQDARTPHDSSVRRDNTTVNAAAGGRDALTPRPSTKKLRFVDDDNDD
jgi:hypothetical protein